MGKSKLLDKHCLFYFSSQATVSTYGDFMIFSTTRETEKLRNRPLVGRRQSKWNVGELVSWMI